MNKYNIYIYIIVDRTRSPYKLFTNINLVIFKQKGKENCSYCLLSSSSPSSELTVSKILTVRDKYRSLDDRVA